MYIFIAMNLNSKIQLKQTELNLSTDQKQRDEIRRKLTILRYQKQIEELKEKIKDLRNSD